MKPTRWTADEWATMNLLLEARAGGACERCGHECGKANRHHRKRRREGGDSLSNIILVGSECHAEIHAHPELARREGFIVSVSRQPEDVPIHWQRRSWRTLHNDGTATQLWEELEDAHA